MIGPVPRKGRPAQALRPNPGILIGVRYGEQHQLPSLLDLQQMYNRCTPFLAPSQNKQCILVGVRCGEEHQLPLLLDLQQMNTLLDTISE